MPSSEGIVHFGYCPDRSLQCFVLEEYMPSAPYSREKAENN